MKLHGEKALKSFQDLIKFWKIKSSKKFEFSKISKNLVVKKALQSLTKKAHQLNKWLAATKVAFLPFQSFRRWRTTRWAFFSFRAASWAEIRLVVQAASRKIDRKRESSRWRCCICWASRRLFDREWQTRLRRFPREARIPRGCCISHRAWQRRRRIVSGKREKLLESHRIHWKFTY